MKKLIHFISLIVAFISGGTTALKFAKKNSENNDTYWKARADKLNIYYGITTEWIQSLQSGCNTSDYFIKNEYHQVVIYGKGILGDLLYNELSKRVGIEIICFADKEGDGEIYFDANIPVVSAEQLKDMRYDVVVVTPVFAFAEVKQELLKVTEEQKILSLQEVVIDCR